MDSRNSQTNLSDNNEEELIMTLQNMTMSDASLARFQSASPKYYLPFSNDIDYWNTVKDLLAPIAEGKSSISEIIATMKKFYYMSTKIDVDLVMLKRFFEISKPEFVQDAEKKVFPFIAKLLLKTPELFPAPIQLLVQGQRGEVVLSKEQCACLLAHMFMGLTQRQSNYQALHPDFSYLTTLVEDPKANYMMEKLKCIYNYFSMISEELPKQYVSFKRYVLNESAHGKTSLDDWLSCQDELLDVTLFETGVIEDAKDAIHVDFANKYLGGGAVEAGNVQEEIMFTVAPECAVGMLFIECMKENEAIHIQGAQTYSNHQGYGYEFRFAGPHKESAELTEGKFLSKDIIAIDAINFYQAGLNHQYKDDFILREVNKAYVGFSAQDPQGSETKKPISTGKWGCGLFGGDAQLKFLIQWIAASRAKRNMLFYAFRDKGIMKGGQLVAKYKGKPIGELMALILAHTKALGTKKIKKPCVFEFIMNT